jgi:Tol biopolymer transport system component/DNA-binding winged helix-turn-helix (wHTH) protein
MALVTKGASHIVQFGIFELDMAAGELHRGGVKIRLQEQPFQILVALLDRPHEVVTREELRTRLWPADTFVDFDRGLNAAIGRLREALGDSAENPRFVETLAKRGYRFIAPVAKAVPANTEVAPTEVRPGDAPTDTQAHVAKSPYWQGLAVAIASLLAIVLGWWALRPRLPKPPLTERRLTANADDVPVTSGVISPDGRYLAYTDSTGFYLRQVDGGETHAVPLPEGFIALAESWFPDSSHLVVSSAESPNKSPGLWEISVMGGTPRMLSDEGSSASVSPDGSQIAFQKRSPTTREFWLMQANGGRARKVLTAEDTDFSPAAWATDGKRIAYVRKTHGVGAEGTEMRIEVFDLANGRTEVVLRQPELDPVIGWLSDGRLIYSVREAPPNDNDSNLWWLRLDPRTARQVGESTRITNDRGIADSLSIASGGRRLALLRRAFQAGVFISQIGAQGKSLSTPQSLTWEGNSFPFSWTTDSKAVLFVSDRNGPMQLFKQAIDQTQPELLVGGRDNVGVPRLSPDGSMVLYLSMPISVEAGTNIRIMGISLKGGPPQFILEGPKIYNLQCARFPATLCVFSEHGAQQARFFTFDLTGNKTELLAAEAKHIYCKNWSLSPDGKYLATNFEQKEPGIQIFSFADSSERKIRVPGWAGTEGIDWAADGKSIWTTHADKDSRRLLNINLNGNVTQMLEEQKQQMGGVIPSPDGRRVGFPKWRMSSNAWLLESF